MKWLITKQAFSVGGRTFLIWSAHNSSKIDPQQFLFVDSPINCIEEHIDSFDLAKDIYLAVLDAPVASKDALSGRLSLLQYRQLKETEYYKRLLEWQQQCHWRLRYVKDEEDNFKDFVGTPSLYNIAKAIQGNKANETTLKLTMTKLLSCVIDGIPIPDNYIQQAVRNINNRSSFSKFEWEKNLSITCALINQKHKGAEYKMGLDLENTDRDYLFGRLLAVAQVLEKTVHNPGDKRPTNAERFMYQFAHSPAKAWRNIQLKLMPYQNRLGDKGIRFQKLINEITNKMNMDDFVEGQPRPLKPSYLLGYYHQREALYTKKETENN